MKKDKEIPGNKENKQAFKHTAYLGVVRNGVNKARGCRRVEWPAGQRGPACPKKDFINICWPWELSA